MHCPCCNGLIRKCENDFGGDDFSKEKCRCSMCGRIYTIRQDMLVEYGKRSGATKYPLFTPKIIEAVEDGEGEIV